MNDPAGPEILSLNRDEAYYYWFHVVKAFFVLVTNGSATKAPTEALFFPAPDFNQKFPLIVFYGDNVSDWLPESEFHAIHVRLQKNGANFSHSQLNMVQCEASVISPEKIKGWTDGILFGRDELWPVPLTWQYSVWDNSYLAHPASHQMLKELHHFRQGKKVPSRPVLNEIKTGALFLYITMMDRYWRAQKYDYTMRENAVTSAGIPGTHSPNSVKIQASKIGLRRAIVSEVLGRVTSLKRQAGRFWAKKNGERLFAETREFPLPIFPIPDAIDDFLAEESDVRYDEVHGAMRMLHMKNRLIEQRVRSLRPD